MAATAVGALPPSQQGPQFKDQADSVAPPGIGSQQNEQRLQPPSPPAEPDQDPATVLAIPATGNEGSNMPWASVVDDNPHSPQIQEPKPAPASTLGIPKHIVQKAERLAAAPAGSNPHEAKNSAMEPSIYREKMPKGAV